MNKDYWLEIVVCTAIIWLSFIAYLGVAYWWNYEHWYCQALKSEYIEWHCIKWTEVIHKFD